MFLIGVRRNSHGNGLPAAGPSFFSLWLFRCTVVVLQDCHQVCNWGMNIFNLYGRKSVPCNGDLFLPSKFSGAEVEIVTRSSLNRYIDMFFFRRLVLLLFIGCRSAIVERVVEKTPLPFTICWILPPLGFF